MLLAPKLIGLLIYSNGLAAGIGKFVFWRRKQCRRFGLAWHLTETLEVRIHRSRVNLTAKLDIDRRFDEIVIV